MSQQGERKTKFSGLLYITKNLIFSCVLMRILNSCVVGLPIWLFWSQILKFGRFLIPLAFLEIKKPEKSGLFWLIFSRICLALAKHCLSCIFITNLLRRGSITTQGAGCTEYCKDFTVALKRIDAIDKKQMHDSVITGKNMLLKIGLVLYRFVTSFNVCFVCGFACFMCICLKTAIWLFWDEVLLFLVKTGWQHCCVD